MKKDHIITLNVKHLYWDILGNTELLFDELQFPLSTPVPLTIFGLTDFFSSYYSTDKYVMTIPKIYGKSSFSGYDKGVNGFNINDPIYPTPLLDRFTNGSYINIYKGYDSDSGQYINNILGIQSINKTSYSTILNSLADRKYFINSLQIDIIGQDAICKQSENSIIVTHYKDNGKLKVDSIDLRTFIKPSTFNKTIIDIPLNCILDKNFSISQYVQTDCWELNYIFNITEL